MSASMASARIDGFCGRRRAPRPCRAGGASPTPRSAATLGQGHGAHDGLADLGEVALVEVGVLAVHVVGDDDAEHGVAQELEALVRRVAGVLRAPGAVHEGRREEVGSEVEAEALDQAGQAGYREVDRRPLQPADDVVDGVAHRLQVLEVLVVDAEARRCAR